MEKTKLIIRTVYFISPFIITLMSYNYLNNIQYVSGGLFEMLVFWLGLCGCGFISFVIILNVLNDVWEWVSN